eukprot:gene24133-9717_t
MFRGSLTPRGPALRLRAACKSRSRHVRVLVADDQHASLASNSTHQIINRGLAVLKDPKRKRLVYLFNRSQHAADEKLRQVIKAVEAKTVIFVRPQSGVRAEDDGLLDMCVHELSTCAVMLDVAEGGEQLLLQSHDSPDVLFSRMKNLDHQLTQPTRFKSLNAFLNDIPEELQLSESLLDQQPTQPTRFKSLNAFLNDIPEELQLSESLSATLNLDFWAKGGSGSDGSESGGGSRAGKGFGKDASSAGKGFGKEASGEGANFSAEASQESADDEADDFSQDASPGFEADSSLSWQLGSDPFDWTVSMSLGDLASETHGRGEGASEEAADILLSWQLGSDFEADSSLTWQLGSDFEADSSLSWQLGSDFEADRSLSWQLGSDFKADSSLSWQLGSDPFFWTVSISLVDLVSEILSRGVGATEEDDQGADPLPLGHLSRRRSTETTAKVVRGQEKRPSGAVKGVVGGQLGGKEWVHNVTWLEEPWQEDQSY